MVNVRATLFVCSVVAATAAAGCQPKDLEVVPLSEVCEAAEYGTTVATAGFLVAPGSMMMCDGTTCEMALSDRGIGGDTNLRIDVRLGRGRNAMVEPPDNWSIDDLVVKDNEGVEHRVGDWIVVHGRILNGEGPCLITPISFVLAAEPPAAAAADGAAPSGGPSGPAGAAAPTEADPTPSPNGKPPSARTQGAPAGAPPTPSAAAGTPPTGAPVEQVPSQLAPTAPTTTPTPAAPTPAAPAPGTPRPGKP